MTWKLMRSAPRDGTPFLACQNLDDAESKMAVCYLSTDSTLCLDATGSIIEDDEFQPTHWMPLPDPP